VIQNPGFLLDHPQNWITSSLCHSQHTLKISEKSVHNFLSYLADTQTDRQTDKVWQKHYLLGGGNYLIYIRWQVTVIYTSNTRRQTKWLFIIPSRLLHRLSSTICQHNTLAPKHFSNCTNAADLLHIKLEIWGKAQRESARRPESDWGKLGSR